MSRRGCLKKIIAVYESEGCSADILRSILGLCGREECFSVFSQGALPPASLPSVCLLCAQTEREALPPGRPVCAVEYGLASGLDPSSFSQIITYSMTENGADFTVRNIRTARDGSVAFEMVGIGIIGRVRLRSEDPVDAVSALAAFAAAVGAGVPFADALEALNRIDFALIRQGC